MSVRMVALLLAALWVVPALGEDAAPRVIEVQMNMNDENGGFVPSEIRARPGDTIRFVNADGVDHNVSFPKSQNPSATTLPRRSPMLGKVGQTYDLLVDLAAGTYNFQCDPHAEMGMIGTLIVE